MKQIKFKKYQLGILFISLLLVISTIGNSTITLTDTSMTDSTNGKIIDFTNNYLSLTNGTFSDNISIGGNIINAANITSWDTGGNTDDDLSDNDTDDLSEGATNFWCDLARIQSLLTNDFHNIGGTDDDVPESGDFGGAGDLNADGAITDGHVTEADLECDNPPSDEYVLTYEDDTGKFMWQWEKQRSEETIEDWVGTMVTGNTETGITVTYDDGGNGTGTLDFVVDGGSGSGDYEITKIMNSKGNNWTATAANIQLAINDLNSTYGGVVYIPAGTYTTTVPINTWNLSVTLQGAGWGVSSVPTSYPTTCIKADIYSGEHDGMYVIEMGEWASTTMSASIKDIMIDGDGTGGTYGSWGGGIRMTNMKHSLIENVFVDDFFNVTNPGIGINVTGNTEGSYYNVFERVYMRRCTVGLAFCNNSNGNQVLSGQIYNDRDLSGTIGEPYPIGIWMRGSGTNWIGNIDIENIPEEGGTGILISTDATVNNRASGKHKFMGTRFEDVWRPFNISSYGDNKFIGCSITGTSVDEWIVDEGGITSLFVGSSNDTYGYDTLDTFIRNSNGKYWPATGANIQSAIDDLTGGGTVWLPAIELSLIDDVLLANNTAIIGCGIGITTIKPALGYSDAWLLKARTGASDNDFNNITVQDLTIDANGVVTNCLRLIGTTDFIVKNVEVRNGAGNAGFYIDECENGLITGCRGFNFTSSSISTFNLGNITNSVISDCSVENQFGVAWAFDFHTLYGCTVSNIRVNNTQYGIKVFGDPGQSGGGNSFSNIVLSNIDDIYDAMWIKREHNSTFSNIVIRGGNNGLVIDGSSKLQLSNIHIYNPNNVGLRIHDDIEACEILNIKGVHIFCTPATSCGLSVNDLMNSTIDGIDIYNSPGTNTFIDCEDLFISSYLADTTTNNGLNLETCKRMFISQCRVVDSSGANIIIDTCEYIIISGFESRGSGTFGIDINTCSYFQLSEGFITDNTGDGIETSASHNYSINNCFITGNAKGIQTGSDSNVTIIWTLFRDNSGDGIECYAVDSVQIQGCTMYGDPFDDNIVGSHKRVAEADNLGMNTI